MCTPSRIWRQHPLLRRAARAHRHPTLSQVPDYPPYTTLSSAPSCGTSTKPRVKVGRRTEREVWVSVHMPTNKSSAVTGGGNANGEEAMAQSTAPGRPVWRRWTRSTSPLPRRRTRQMMKKRRGQGQEHMDAGRRQSIMLAAGPESKPPGPGSRE